MPKLSVCIPVEPGFAPPHYLVGQLLQKADSDIEVIVAPFGTGGCDDTLVALAAGDPRLKILPAAPETISAANFWIGTVAAADGDWITLIYPDDMLEPDLPKLLVHLEQNHPGADALGWNAFQISASAPRTIKATVPLPVLHDTTILDKTAMLDAFFQWTGSQQIPRAPFGLFHGALKRGLVDQILASSGEASWLTPLPRFEWTARALIFANELALCNRPLSAASVTPFQPVAIASVLAGFPFDARIGLTAAIAEIQARVLHDLGVNWEGFGPAFVKACMIDCMLEHDEPSFERKGQAYFTAIHHMPGGAALAAEFRPQFFPQPPEDTRRGLHGNTLLIDRFIGNARTAQEFYAVAWAMMSPVPIMIDRPDILAQNVQTTW